MDPLDLFKQMQSLFADNTRLLLRSVAGPGGREKVKVLVHCSGVSITPFLNKIGGAFYHCYHCYHNASDPCVSLDNPDNKWFCDHLRDVNMEPRFGCVDWVYTLKAGQGGLILVRYVQFQASTELSWSAGKLIASRNGLEMKGKG